jgi:hypothetical protein
MTGAPARGRPAGVARAKPERRFNRNILAERECQLARVPLFDWPVWLVILTDRKRRGQLGARVAKRIRLRTYTAMTVKPQTKAAVILTALALLVLVVAIKNGIL